MRHYGAKDANTTTKSPQMMRKQARTKKVITCCVIWIAEDATSSGIIFTRKRDNPYQNPVTTGKNIQNVKSSLKD